VCVASCVSCSVQLQWLAAWQPLGIYTPAVSIVLVGVLQGAGVSMHVCSSPAIPRQNQWPLYSSTLLQNQLEPLRMDLPVLPDLADAFVGGTFQPSSNSSSLDEQYLLTPGAVTMQACRWERTWSCCAFSQPTSQHRVCCCWLQGGMVGQHCTQADSQARGLTRALISCGLHDGLCGGLTMPGRLYAGEDAGGMRQPWNIRQMPYPISCIRM
jgi:hypothetical protein